MVLLMISSSSLVFAVDHDYENHWARNEINYMKDNGIVKGYLDGTFKPDNNMTRVEFYTVINRLMEFTELEEDIQFEDVLESDWFYVQVQKAIKAKYIEPETKLEPNRNITRGEVALIIGKLFDIELDENAAKEFLDYEFFNDDAKGIIGGLKKAGLVNGFPDGRFGPEAEITRAEVVKMLHSVCIKCNIPEKEVKPPC